MSAARVDAATAPPPITEEGLVAVAIVLSFAAGATDAFAFLQLGGIFTANMTGNLILAGLFERPGFPVTLIAAVVAIAVFAGAVLLGFVATRPSRPGASWAAIPLLVALGAQAAVAVLWLVAPRPLGMPLTLTAIAVSAVAMAMQTVVGRRLETRSGVTTTFATGTLTALMKSISDRQRGVRLLQLLSVLMLTVGAIGGALAVGVSPLLGAALPILPSAAALGIVLATRRRA